jgi:hypothetical protein
VEVTWLSSGRWMRVGRSHPPASIMFTGADA